MTLIAEGHCTRFHITDHPPPQPQSLPYPAALTPAPRPGRRSTRRRFTSISVAVYLAVSVSLAISVYLTVSVAPAVSGFGSWSLCVVLDWLVTIQMRLYCVFMRLFCQCGARASNSHRGGRSVYCFNADWQITAISENEIRLFQNSYKQINCAFTHKTAS